jgi:hypothetical protein
MKRTRIRDAAAAALVPFEGSPRAPKRQARLAPLRFASLVLGAMTSGCYVQATAATEECRTVEVRNRHDVEVCNTRCSDHICREHCTERERWSREHRCWVE